MIAVACVALYLLAGLVSVAIADRWLDFDTNMDSDIAAAAGLALFWPVAAIFGALAALIILALRISRGDA